MGNALSPLRDLENWALRWYVHTEGTVGGTLLGNVPYGSMTGRGRK
jgi:hypothetical protein